MFRSDVEALAAITEASPEAARWDAAAFAGFLDDPARGQVLVAEQEHAVAGYACYRIVGDEVELLNLAVRPLLRRQGIGRFLLRQVLERGSQHGAAKISLEVRASNQAALALYRRFGLAQVGFRPGYYLNPPDDALILSRPLRQMARA